MISDIEVRRRIVEWRNHNPLCRDDFSEWAGSAIPFYRELLDDIGLVDVAVYLDIQSNGDLGDITLRDALGNEIVVPDGEEIGDEDDAEECEMAAEEVVNFFIVLAQHHASPAARKRIWVTSIEGPHRRSR